jgi:hypothetical protein
LAERPRLTTRQVTSGGPPPQLLRDPGQPQNGSPAAVLIGVDDWESIHETLHWLSQPGIAESVAESEADVAAGRTYGEDEIRAAYQVPRHPR